MSAAIQAPLAGTREFSRAPRRRPAAGQRSLLAAAIAAASGGAVAGVAFERRRQLGTRFWRAEALQAWKLRVAVGLTHRDAADRVECDDTTLGIAGGITYGSGRPLFRCARALGHRGPHSIDRTPGPNSTTWVRATAPAFNDFPE